MQYHNIFRLLDELGVHDALTDWEKSGFWDREHGLTIEAGPVCAALSPLTNDPGTCTAPMCPLLPDVNAVSSGTRVQLQDQAADHAGPICAHPPTLQVLHCLCRMMQLGRGVPGACVSMSCTHARRQALLQIRSLVKVQAPSAGRQGHHGAAAGSCV